MFSNFSHSFLGVSDLRIEDDIHHQVDGCVWGAGGVCALLPVTGGRVPLPAGLWLGRELLHGHHRCDEKVLELKVFMKHIMFILK